MITAIKPIYRRDKRLYEVQVEENAQLNLVGLAQAGFYVTDNLAAALSLITAGRCAWFNGLNARQQEAIREWLISNI